MIVYVVFSLKSAANAPKVTSGGLFRRHSTYRFRYFCLFVLPLLLLVFSACISNSEVIVNNLSFSALTLLVGRQEEHLACN